MPHTSSISTAGLQESQPKGVGSPRYSHAAVCHGHGVVRQGIAGDLAVVGAGGRREHIARVHVVGVNRVVPLEGPGTGRTGIQLSHSPGLQGSTILMGTTLTIHSTPSEPTNHPLLRPQPAHCLNQHTLSEHTQSTALKTFSIF